MVQHAGIEVIIFILWILFSIYGGIQQQKKKKQNQPEVRPADNADTPEDPFKKILEELLGKQEETAPAPARKKHSTQKQVQNEYKKPVYESIPSDYKGTQGSMPSSTTIAREHPYAFGNLESIEAKYEKPHFMRPDEEGQPQTTTNPSAGASFSANVKNPRKYGMSVGGKRISMRDALLAQVILEKRF